jgi:hypothetical protein
MSNDNEPQESTTPQVVAKYRDNPSKLEGRFTYDELIELSEKFLPFTEVYLQEEEPDGSVKLKHLGTMRVMVLPPKDVAMEPPSPSSLPPEGDDSPEAEVSEPEQLSLTPPEDPLPPLSSKEPGGLFSKVFSK